MGYLLSVALSRGSQRRSFGRALKALCSLVVLACALLFTRGVSAECRIPAPKAQFADAIVRVGGASFMLELNGVSAVIEPQLGRSEARVLVTAPLRFTAEYPLTRLRFALVNSRPREGGRFGAWNRPCKRDANSRRHRLSTLSFGAAGFVFLAGLAWVGWIGLTLHERLLEADTIALGTGLVFLGKVVVAWIIFASARGLFRAGERFSLPIQEYLRSLESSSKSREDDPFGIVERVLQLMQAVKDLGNKS